LLAPPTVDEKRKGGPKERAALLGRLGGFRKKGEESLGQAFGRNFGGEEKKKFTNQM